MLMTLWRPVVLFLLWPLWWPLAVLLLVVTAHGYMSGPATGLSRLTLWTNARWLALLACGYRDAK